MGRWREGLNSRRHGRERILNLSNKSHICLRIWKNKSCNKNLCLEKIVFSWDSRELLPKKIKESIIYKTTKIEKWARDISKVEKYGFLVSPLSSYWRNTDKLGSNFGINFCYPFRTQSPTHHVPVVFRQKNHCQLSSVRFLDTCRRNRLLDHSTNHSGGRGIRDKIWRWT